VNERLAEGSGERGGTLGAFRRAVGVYGVVGLVVVVTDQVTKWWAVGALTRAFEGEQGEALAFGERVGRFLWQRHPARRGSVEVLEDFWHFRYVENPGAAWGFLSRTGESFRTPLFLVVSVLAMVFIVAYFRRTDASQRLLRFGLALVFGGAVGNFLDRVRLGYVIDFVDWHWFDKATWPTFNVADAGISVGVVILLLQSFFHRKGEEGAGKKRGDGGRRAA
jgi:signal peptidase II